MNEEELENILDELIASMEALVASGANISTDLLNSVAEEINSLNSQIQALHEQRTIAPLPPVAGAAPTPTAQLLWILSGQQPDAFVNYLQNYPNAEARGLVNNPEELQRNLNYLQQMMPQVPMGQADGIPHANLNSSNIYGFKYDRKRNKLFVRFQGGSVYGYDDVPPGIFQAFQAGAHQATTDGQNQYGRWWRGKSPSLGAAFSALIKNGGYEYQRLS